MRVTEDTILKLGVLFIWHLQMQYLQSKCNCLTTQRRCGSWFYSFIEKRCCFSPQPCKLTLKSISITRVIFNKRFMNSSCIMFSDLISLHQYRCLWETVRSASAAYESSNTFTPMHLWCSHRPSEPRRGSSSHQAARRLSSAIISSAIWRSELVRWAKV